MLYSYSGIVVGIKKHTLSQALKCMNLIGIMLSWRIQTQKKYTLYDCIYLKFKSTKNESIVIKINIVATFAD